MGHTAVAVQPTNNKMLGELFKTNVQNLYARPSAPSVLHLLDQTEQQSNQDIAAVKRRRRMLMRDLFDTTRRNAAADLAELDVVAAGGVGASDGDAWGGLHRCHLSCNLVQNLILFNQLENLKF